jgi:hypothetical protein
MESETESILTLVRLAAGGWPMDTRVLVCDTHQKIHALIDYEEFYGMRGEQEPEMDLNVPEITRAN